MKPREFHLKDFPVNKIRIKLRNQPQFIDESIRSFGSIKKLAMALSVSSQLVYKWKKLNLFIPLDSLTKIINYQKLDWDAVEKEVIAYKGPNLSLTVAHPQLPIIESPELFALLAHLIADGSVNKNGIPVYTNSNQQLIDNFQNLLIKVFGNVEVKINKIRPTVYQLRSSKVVADLLQTFYPINFGSLKATIPTRLKDLPEEYSIALIRAFFDDEGHVDFNHRLTIGLRNRKALYSLRSLLIDKLGFKHISNLNASSKKDFYFSILAGDLEKYHNLIGFNHSLKSLKLSQIIEMRKNTKGRIRGEPGVTKNKILELLGSQNLSTEDLALKLGLRKTNISIPLNQLQENGLVRPFSKINQATIWTRLEG